MHRATCLATSYIHSPSRSSTLVARIANRVTAPCTARFPPAAARGPMAFGLRLVRHFFLSFFLSSCQPVACCAGMLHPACMLAPFSK
jgi:hypothetical protein